MYKTIIIILMALTAFSCKKEKINPIETPIVTGKFTDARDGQEYKWVEIGGQTWMAENLNYYTSAGSWYYNDDSTAYADVYGRLYNWETAQTIAPDGWHLPSYEEWTQLFNSLGGIDVAGGKMKETGTSLWNSPNTGASNSSGFSALPAGSQFPTYSADIGDEACFWSSSEDNSNYAYFLILSQDKKDIFDNWYHKYYGFSVRCIKN